VCVQQTLGEPGTIVYFGKTKLSAKISAFEDEMRDDQKQQLAPSQKVDVIKIGRPLVY
jgi:hypothetical protein